MKYLIVVDMQNDFTYGSLRNPEAIILIPVIENKIKNFDGKIIFTRDTHLYNYMSTQEGRKLPIPHCMDGTDGWEIVKELDELRILYEADVIDKPAFGSMELCRRLCNINEVDPIEEIELVGVCTDICVISNAMILKSALPEVRIVVDSRCCAGVTRKSHQTALDAMQACQIDVI